VLNTHKIAALLLVLSLSAAACSDDATTATETTATTAAPAPTTTAAKTDGSMEDDAAMAEEGTIVDVATEAGDFTTLLAAAKAAGLVDTLNGKGPLTLFAPTDDAFAAALTDLGLTADELLADKETLTSILTYHVVAGEVLSTDLTNGMKAPTVNGADLKVDLSNGVKINGAKVTTPDIKASNGVIHVIDSVLLPPAS
jgi:transforming growth factor-beta-induced protein